ncbi:MAG: GPW/gp25 family protein [Lachnospiraceae bacterium]|nr:GPW/gp25 family protein [Lachnospiraceae bacterium]
MDSEFLGTGMKFPPTINPSTGRFETSSGIASVKESVYVILMTQKTERWLRPEFGSEIQRFAFTDPNATRLNLMRMDIVNDIKMSEPRVSDVTVNFDAQSKPGYLLIDIRYTVAETNTRDNLVFPFYLYGASEENNEEQQG